MHDGKNENQRKIQWRIENGENSTVLVRPSVFCIVWFASQFKKHETLEFLGGSQKSVSLVCKGNSGNPMNIIPQKHVVDKIAFVENHVKYPVCVDEIHGNSHLVSGPEGL